MDTVYDVISTGANFFGPIGSLVSGAMALNKGLSNIFGSTSGMTLQDAILGSAFMPAPVKWVNMIGANTTSSFKN
jgi:choline-glycine betaine transporter